MSSNVDRIKNLYAAFARGDVPTVLSGLSPDIEWTEAEGFPLAGTYHGPDAVLSGVFGRLATEWDGFAAVPREYVSADETVVALGTYSGACVATGKQFSAEFAHVWRLRDGKACYFRQIVDSAMVNRAMG